MKTGNTRGRPDAVDGILAASMEPGHEDREYWRFHEYRRH